MVEGEAASQHTFDKFTSQHRQQYSTAYSNVHRECPHGQTRS